MPADLNLNFLPVPTMSYKESVYVRLKKKHREKRRNRGEAIIRKKNPGNDRINWL